MVTSARDDSGMLVSECREQRHDLLTPAAYRSVARIVRAVRDGAESARHPLRPLVTPADTAHQRGYELGWSAACTLVQLTAAEQGQSIADGDA